MTLTELEAEIITDAARLWDKICKAVGDEETRAADLAELVGPIHLIQRYFMAQSAVRACPGQYRGLGEIIG